MADWIKKAVKPSHKGLFAEKAARAGKTTREYAAEKAGASGTLGKEARFAETVMGLSKKKRGLPYKSRKD
jgi:hypothetical protein